jgi:hypothetical protein
VLVKYLKNATLPGRLKEIRFFNLQLLIKKPNLREVIIIVVVKTVFIFIFFLSPFVIHAQHDTLYYATYDHKITTRFYFSKKSTSAKLQRINNKYELRYLPNTTLNMGIGATYKWATLNLAYGFSFLNPEQGRGKTEYLDLQIHNYKQKFIIDVFGQFYKGFYLNPKGYATTGDQYYLRSDLQVHQVGASSQYIFNHKRFSYQASFLQNEWQKKSAGTFLAGFETYFGTILGDSSFVPASVDKDIAAKNVKVLQFYEFGPNIGYAYTFVVKKHFFLTGSLSESFDFGKNVTMSNSGRERNFGITPNTFIRVFAGYNSSKWALSILYLNNSVSLESGKFARKIVLSTENYRLNLVHRFTIRAKKPKRRINNQDI